ncbi:CadD family cadmium resistance transporter [Salinicoccus albus]|uniref:CadD family cadmium resistance transporter n=1 Tax=Salinicoccus albus TaxID=418756 RepID=UPI00037F6177|nr:CadD family cadmium resistance transporter [Salinicoccus albus]
MFQTITIATVLYFATAIDLITILLIFFGRAQTKKQYRNIYLGQYLGSITLIIISLILAYVLGFVPQKWILGLLGFIPIYFGIKTLFSDDSAEEENAENQLQKKGLNKLTSIVALVVIGSCGADNIGLFVPYFVSLNVQSLVITLIVFLVLIFVLAFVAHKISDIPGVGEVIENYSRWIITVIYIGLGLFIIIENKTIQVIFEMLFS